MLEQGMSGNGVEPTRREREIVDARHCKPCVIVLSPRTKLGGTELGWFEIDCQRPVPARLD